MRLFPRVVAIGVLIAATLMAASTNARAQVTTATLYGAVHDSSGGILPGVNVTVTYQGTNLTREAVTDAVGNLRCPAFLPARMPSRSSFRGSRPTPARA